MIQAQVTMSSEQLNNHQSKPGQEFVFPQGIAGFPDATRFGFIYEGIGDMVCMQSIEQPDAAFVLTPWDVERLGQPPKLNVEQCKSLALKDASEVMWMLVLNPFADQEWVTANLKAPIALSESSRRGFQLIRPESEHELRFRWMPQPKRK